MLVVSTVGSDFSIFYASLVHSGLKLASSVHLRLVRRLKSNWEKSGFCPIGTNLIHKAYIIVLFVNIGEGECVLMTSYLQYMSRYQTFYYLISNFQLKNNTDFIGLHLLFTDTSLDY